MIKVIEKECKKKHYSMELSHIESDEDEVDVALKEKQDELMIFVHYNNKNTCVISKRKCVK